MTPPARRARGALAYAWRRTLHNLPQKIVALLVAMGLWYVATSDRRETVESSFTTQLRVLDETRGEGGVDRRSVSGLERNVRVTISGPRRRLANVSSDDINASVDVTGVREGPFSEPINVQVPEGLRLVRFAPSVASGFVDAEVTRTLPVRLSLTNLPERALPRFDVSPRSVQVTGAQRVVESVASVITVPVSLARGASAEARLLAIDENGRPVTDVRVSPATVTVERTDPGDLPIKTVPVELPPVPQGFEVVSVEIEPPQARLLGEPGALANVSRVVAGVTYREGRYDARANLRLPNGVRSLDTVTVTLDVRRKGANP
ncbi:CdaR family protein [Deinococcus pimensis]|uniref:CdaR family protein n=1 Tax=Deinococcus pimensis TaxID=309888 RepID=UPI0004AFFAC0|nr:CdaR family protein [Deinococcus pimensis]